MNRKALQLAISTLILLILGVFVLIGLAYFLTDGFSNLKESSQPFLDSTRSSSIKSACSLACSNQDRLAFCCQNHTVQEEEIKCTDSRLEVDCSLDCSSFQC